MRRRRVAAWAAMAVFLLPAVEAQDPPKVKQKVVFGVKPTQKSTADSSAHKVDSTGTRPAATDTARSRTPSL